MNPKKTTPRIEICWQEGGPPPDLDEQAISAALSKFLHLLKYDQSGLSLLMAGDRQLKALNKTHRGQDNPTDILAWSYNEGADQSYLEGADQPGILGELALSLEQAKRQATENGWGLQTEVLRLLAHGCVHLAGYDHDTAENDQEMKEIEIRLLAAIGLSGIYDLEEDLK